MGGGARKTNPPPGKPKGKQHGGAAKCRKREISRSSERQKEIKGLQVAKKRTSAIG